MGMSEFHLTNNMRVLCTATSGLGLLLGTGGRGQKLLSTALAAEVECLSIAFGVESGCFVHDHSADRVFGLGFRFFHGHAPFLIVVVNAIDFFFHLDMHINSQLFCVIRNFLFPFFNRLVISSVSAVALMDMITMFADICIAPGAGVSSTPHA